jgi:hypothetical protein
MLQHLRRTKESKGKRLKERKRDREIVGNKRNREREKF